MNLLQWFKSFTLSSEYYYMMFLLYDKRNAEIDLNEIVQIKIRVEKYDID